MSLTSRIVRVGSILRMQVRDQGPNAVEALEVACASLAHGCESGFVRDLERQRFRGVLVCGRIDTKTKERAASALEATKAIFSALRKKIAARPLLGFVRRSRPGG